MRNTAEHGLAEPARGGVVTPSAAPTVKPIAPVGRRNSGAPPLGGFAGPPAIGRPEAPGAGEFEGAAPPPRGVGAAGAPMLDTKGTSARSVPSRARVFREVRLSERQFREGVAAELERLASEKPKGKTRRSLRKKAQRVRECGQFVLVRDCGRCGDAIADTARLLTTCQARCCPTCARYLANEARQKACALIDAIKPISGGAFFMLTFTARFDPTDPAEFEQAALRARCQRVKQGAAYVWRRVLKHEGAGLMTGLEVGPGGVAHVHAVYYGRWQDVNVIRAAWLEKVPDSPQVRVDQIKDPKRKVPEVFKYMVKCASPKADGSAAKGVDPRLAARVESALHGLRRAEPYGAFRGMDIEEEPAAEEPTAIACESCGNTSGPFPERPVPRAEWARRHPGRRLQMSRFGAAPLPAHQKMKGENDHELKGLEHFRQPRKRNRRRELQQPGHDRDGGPRATRTAHVPSPRGRRADRRGPQDAPERDQGWGHQVHPTGAAATHPAGRGPQTPRALIPSRPVPARDMPPKEQPDGGQTR